VPLLSGKRTAAETRSAEFRPGLRLWPRNLSKDFFGLQMLVEGDPGIFALDPHDLAPAPHALAFKAGGRSFWWKALAFDQRALLRQIAQLDRKRPAVDLDRRR